MKPGGFMFFLFSRENSVGNRGFYLGNQIRIDRFPAFVGDLEHQFSIFPIDWVSNHPNQLIFQRGGKKPASS